MSESVEDKLRRLAVVHQQIKQLQEEEDAIAADLGASKVRGVRTAMAGILGVSLEALRLRYGAAQSVGSSVREAAEQ